MMKQHAKALVILIGLGCLFWIHPAFAAEGDPAVSWSVEIFNAIVKVLSWGWMLLAFLAGKLMSNDFIYGTFIHLDSALFKLWNYMKNIANFILGFLFLAGILKSFFSKDAFELKKVLPRFLLAGVLIQMSWFIMGAFVDLANIATAAVGAFPQQFIQGSTDNLSKSKMAQMAVTVPERVEISLAKNDEHIKTYTGKQTIESMFGSFNNMSGPLLFMGASIFRFQDYDILNQDVTNIKNFSIGLFIKLFLLLAFCVPLLILIVINLIRIFRLWIWISFAPLAAISWSFGDKESPGFVKTAGEKLGFGKLTDVLSLVFQPVVMIGSLALVMILSIGMFYVLGGDPGNQQSSTTFEESIDNLTFTADSSQSTIADRNSGTEITIEGDLFKSVGNFVGGMTGYLILTCFTIVLLWSLLKISKDFSKFTKGAANSIFDRSEKLVTNVNVIPFGGKATSIAGLSKTGRSLKQTYVEGGYYANKKQDQIDRLQSQFYSSEFGKTVKKTFGVNEAEIYNSDISIPDENQLILATPGGANNIIEKIRELTKGKQVSAQSKVFKRAFNDLMNKSADFRSFMLKGTQLSEEDLKDKQDILGDKGDVGTKMRNFLAYVVNNKEITTSSPLNQDKITKFLAENFNANLLPTTPFSLDAKEETSKK